MYISTSFYVLCTPNAGQNFFYIVHAVKLKKEEALKLRNFLEKNIFFSYFPQKMLKKHLLTSIWSGRHPNAGQNIPCL